MKAILLAAAAVLAMPALAQTQSTGSPPMSGAPTQQTPPTSSDPAMADPAMADPATPTDPAMQADPAMQTDPAMATPPPQSTDTMSAPMAGQPMGGMTAGGYQPSVPATTGPAQPGAVVRFQAAPSPDQAYPAPAPLASYPVCRRGQFDKCRNAGGR